MKKTMFFAVLMLVCLFSMSCDNTDQPKEVFKIIYKSPDIVYFEVPHIAQGENLKAFQVKNVGKVVKEHFKYFQPKADVYMPCNIIVAQTQDSYKFELYKTLYIAGIREIRTFTPDPISGVVQLTDVANDDNSKLIKKIKNSIKFDKADVYERWDINEYTMNERAELVELSKKEPLEKILPVLLKYRVEKIHGIILYRGCESRQYMEHPWDEPRLSSLGRKAQMANYLLSYFINQKLDSSIAGTLLKQLESTTSIEDKNYLICCFAHHRWHPDAEETLYKLGTDKTQDMDVRCCAFFVLLRRCDVNKYLPPAFETIAELEKPEDKLHKFNMTIQTSNNNYKMNDETRKLYLSTGFKFLLELPDDKLDSGYFVATSLGCHLKIENDFKPSQTRSDKKYDGNEGFNLFATETVQNALDWYHKNQDN